MASGTLFRAGPARGQMRILYVASAIDAGGASGGWTHVTEVACGLRALGHEVLVLARSSGHVHASVGCGVRLATTRLPKYLALLSTPRISRLVRRFRPDVIIERYYNFAGAGLIVAH